MGNVEPDAAPVPASDAGAVRKTVTVLFADLVGSTAFGEQVDAESARREMAKYHVLAQSVIDENGGTIAKFIGDGVMAVFGIPEIAEDDAVRAVNAGVDLQAGFVGIATHVRDQYGIEIGLRVGVNTGEIVIAEDDADLVGDAINTAARIEAACTPGEVLVGEPTWRLTRSAIDYEAHEEVSAKGKEEPVATFQVLSRAHDDELHTPFVGREAELAQLTHAFDTAARDGQPRLVTVVGDPGVGKTRLATELRDHTSDRARTFELRVEPSGTTTFGPVADLVRATVGLDDSTDPESVMDRIHDFLGPDVADAPRLAPLLAGFVGAAPTRSTEESFWATRRLIEVLARDEPVVLVIDDVQWAEPLFLDLIEHLVDWVDRPALLLGLARPELREIRSSLVETGRRVSDVVTLEGLDAAATEALAAQMLGTDHLPGGLAARLPESTDGNPLFVRELVRMLVDDGVITRTDGGWELAIDSEAVTVPPTIQSLLASRVERMPADERRVVELASVVGSEFALGALRHLLPSVDRGELDRTLERLRRKDIIEATGSYWGDEPLFRFHHVLFRDAAYRRLLKQRRAELHLQTARWTEEAAARFTGEHEIAIAHHFEQAHEYLSELGAVDGETVAIGRRAAELLHTAAQSALDQDDLAAAGSLAQRALARLESDARERAELLLIACEALLSSGDMRAGRPRLDELAAIAEGSDRLGAWVDAFEGQWVVLTQPERLGSSEPVVAEAADRLDKLDDQAGVAKARLVRALILARLGRVGDCEAELDQALTAARAAEDRRRITAVLGAAPLAALWGPSPVARAGGRCLDIIRLLRITSASPIVEATSIRCQGVLEAMRGRFDQARDLIERARELVEDLGTSHGLFETEMFAGLVELLAGNAAEAESHLRDAYSGLRLLGVGSDAGQAAALLARALVIQGRFDEAEDLAVDSDALAGQNLQTAIASRAMRAEIASARGLDGEGLALAEEAVALAAATDLTFNHARAVASLASVQARAGDSIGASTASDEARRLFEAKGAVPFTVTAPRSAPDPSPATQASRTELANRAGELGRRFWECLFDRRDLDAALDLVADDAFVSDRRRMLQNTMSKSDIGGWFRELVESGTRIDWEYRVLAARGDDLCLQRSVATSPGSTFGNQIIGLGELNADGLLARYTLYDPEDLQAAVEELDRRWVEREPTVAPLIELMQALRSAITTNDPASLQALLTEDFALTDHRNVSLPNLDRDGLIAWVDDLVKQVGEFTVVPRQYHRITSNRVLVTTDRYGHADHGGDIFWAALDLFTITDGRISRWELLDEADLDTALPRFDELDSALRTTGPTNASVEHTRALWVALYDHRDIEECLDLIAEDYVVEDRRTIGSAQMTKKDLPAWWSEIARSPEEIEWTLEAVAMRDDNLSLIRRVMNRSESTFGTDVLYVTELDEDGLSRSVAVFDPDELYAAIDELDRRWLASDPAVPAEVVDVVRSLQASVASNDFATARALLTDDFELIDHRDFELPTLDAHGWIERIATISGQIEGHIPVSQRYRRISTRRALVTTDRHGHADHAGTVAWTNHDLFTVTDGRISRWEMFDEDDLDAALARFDELESTGPVTHLTNSSVEAGRMFWVAWYDLSDADGNGYLELLADDFVVEDRRPLSLADNVTGDELPAYRGDMIASGDRVDWDYEPLAVRGDRLALAIRRSRRVGSTFGNEFLWLAELDDQGLARRHVMFDHEDLPVAIEELDRRWTETDPDLPADVVQVIRSLQASVGSNDFTTAASLLTDDFEWIDHRNFEVPSLDAGGWIERIMTISDQIEGHFPVSQRYHRISPTRAVVTTSRYGHADHGGTVAWTSQALFTVTDGRIRRWEMFAEADLDAALARFDELESAGPTARLANDAVKAAQRYWAAWYDLSDVDGSRFLDLLADDFRTEDRRSFSLASLARDDVPAYRREIIASQEQVDWDYEPLAIRGDHLVLARRRSTRTGSTFGSDVLCLHELDGTGRTVRHVDFEPADIGSAIEELDRLWIETDPDLPADVIDTVRSFQADIVANDAESMKALQADDFEFTDHRHAPLPTLDAQGFRDATTSLVDQVDGLALFSSQYHRVSRTRCLETTHRMGRTDDGGEVSWLDHILFTVVDGRIVSMERFDEDDLDAALARFEELESASTSTPVQPKTLAETAVEKLVETFNAHDYAAMAEMLDPAFTIETRRPLGIPMLDAQEFVGTIREIFEVTPDARFTIATVATRGDRFHLGTLAWGGEAGFFTEILIVSDVDEDGVVRRLISFDPDQLYDAIDQLDEWYAENVGHESTLPIRLADEASRFYTTAEYESLRQILTDDFSSVDHRPSSFGQLDGDGWIARARSMHEVSPGFRLIHTTVHRSTDAGVVSRTQVTNPDTLGEWDLAGIHLIEGTKLARIELFEYENLATALARFNELTGRPPAPHPPRTLAEKAGARHVEALNRRDYDTLAAMLAPDFTMESRRQLGTPPMKAGAWIQMVKEINDLTAGVRWSHENIATRGEHLLARRMGWTAGSGFVNERIALEHWDEAGRLVRVLTFDPEQLYDAMAQLDEWFGETIGEEAARSLAIADRAIAHYTTGELDRLELLLAGDFVTLDHRPSSFGELDRNASLRAAESLHEVMPGFTIVATAVPRVTERGVVARTRTTNADSLGEWDLAAVIVCADGLLSRVEFFEIEELDAALARFDELTTRTLRHESPKTRAQRSAERIIDLFKSGDFDAIGSMLTSGFRMEVRRPLGPPPLTAEDWIATLREISQLDGAVQLASDSIATRGERFALYKTRWSGDSGFFTEILLVFDCDDEGCIQKAVSFDTDQIHDAIDQLDEWYAETVGQESTLPIRIADQACRFYMAAEFEPLRGIVADDFVFVDHRPASFGQLDSDGWMARARSLHEVSPGFRLIHTTVHRSTDAGVVTRTQITNPDTLGEWDLAAIHLLEGRKLARIELFDHDDLDAALARFDELESGSARSQLPNRAVEMSRAMWEALFDRHSLDDYRSLLANDMVAKDHRALVRWDMNARAVQRWFDEVISGREFDWSQTALAVRAEHLALIATSARSTTSDFATEFLEVVEVDPSGRQTRYAVFDPEQLYDAVAQLDEWYTETLDDSSARAFAVICEFNRAYAEGDTDRVRSMLSVEFRSTDHRLASFEKLDADGLLARVRTLHEVVDGVQIVAEAIHRLTDQGMVHSARVTSSTQNEWELAILEQFDGEGLITRLDFFEIEELDAALARFDELTTEPVASDQSETIAEKVVAHSVEARNRHDYDTLAAMLTPDFTIETRRQLGTPPMNAGGWIEMVKEINDLTEGVRWSHETLATRGEHLDAHRTRWTAGSGFVNERISLVEVDETGRFTRTLTFDPDQLYDAIDQLDEWYAETLSEPAAATFEIQRRFDRAYSSGDFDKIEQILADDFVTVDHRSRGFETADKAAQMERLKSRHEVDPGFQLITAAVYRISEHGLVQRYRFTNPESLAEWDLVGVTLTRAGQNTRTEIFEVEDLDAALTRFDELTADADG